MLFLLKRTWPAALAALVVLAGVGGFLRWMLDHGPPCTLSLHTVTLGFGVFCVIVLSDGTIHGLMQLAFGDPYLDRYRELAAEFREQSLAAVFVGALVAGVGEELLFRGISTDPMYLGGGAVLFGLLHHIRRRLWPFTVWAVWQGLLIAGALVWSGDLAVTMTAHFLHDLTGFLIFRRFNRTG